MSARISFKLGVSIYTYIIHNKPTFLSNNNLHALSLVVNLCIPFLYDIISVGKPQPRAGPPPTHQMTAFPPGN